MSKEVDLIQYLSYWRNQCAHDSSAMPEAKFSIFLDGLLDILDPTGNVRHD